MTIRDQSFTVAACVAAHARAFPDRVAVDELAPPGAQRLGTVAYGELKHRWTYADLWERTQAIAAALGPVEPGAHGPMVGVLLPNGADHIVAYLACQLIGAAAVPINTQLTGPEIDFILSDSGASVLLTSDPFMNAARGLDTDVAVIDTAQIERVNKRNAPALAEALGDAARERLAVIAYTSGTTGFPKGVMVRNGDLLDRAAQWAWTFGLSPTRVLSTPVRSSTCPMAASVSLISWLVGTTGCSPSSTLTLQ